MKNCNYMSLSCLQPYNSGLDALQPTDGSDFSLHMANSTNGYDLGGGIDNTFYQEFNCGNESLDFASQFSYFSPVAQSSFLPTAIDNLALASPPPLMDYHYGLPCDSSLKSHSLLFQPCESESLPQRNNIIRDITRADISKTNKKRKAGHQIIDIRQPKLAAVRRTQKLSDKINALQELVSPYGKTDTASVLQEACIYIKIIHQELRRLSISYFEARSFLSQFQGDLERQADLRSRGLCLVPISIMKRLTRSENWGNQHQAASRNSGKPRSL